MHKIDGLENVSMFGEPKTASNDHETTVIIKPIYGTRRQYRRICEKRRTNR